MNSHALCIILVLKMDRETKILLLIVTVQVIVIGLYITSVVVAASDSVAINIGIASNRSFTVGVPCICDVLVECQDGQIVNEQVIEFIWNTSEPYRWEC